MPDFPAILRHEHLQEITGLRQTAAMRRALKKANLPFKEVNGRLTATVDSWTAAQVGRAQQVGGPNFDALTQGRTR